MFISKTHRHRVSGLAAASLLAAVSACAPTSTEVEMASTSAPPAFAPPPTTPATPVAKPAQDMQAVLDALARLGGKPIETLAPAEARRQPSAADAAKAVMAARGIPTVPDPSVTTQERAYGADPWQKARIYAPAGAPAGGALPVIVYYHGGGWVIADLDTYDATPRMLAKQLNAIVVSVEYRHAPEAKFPAQHDDAAAAYAWTLKNAASWGGDPAVIALAGESAGGNLAVATAIHARDNGLTIPRHILSVYPIGNSDKMLPAKIANGNAKPLNSAMLDWFTYYVTRSPADAQDPRINLVGANLRGLPPVTIVNAQIDPLLSDGETLADALRRAGVSVEQRTFPGVTHEFFGMGQVVRGAYDANAYALARLRPALVK